MSSAHDQPARDAAAGASRALTSFLFIPYAPAWSILVIAIDTLVIWALASPRRARA